MPKWTEEESRELLSLSWLAPNYPRINEEMKARGWLDRTSHSLESQLNKIQERSTNRRRPKAYGQKPWSSNEDDILLAGRRRGHGSEQISRQLALNGYKRTEASVRRRIYKLRTMAPAAPIQGKPSPIPFTEAEPKKDAAVVNPQHTVYIAFSAQVFGIYLSHGRKIVTTVLERWEGRALRDLANARPGLLTVRLPEDPLTEDWVLEATFSKLFVESADSLLDYLTQTQPSLTVDQKKTC